MFILGADERGLYLHAVFPFNLGLWMMPILIPWEVLEVRRDRLRTMLFQGAVFSLDFHGIIIEIGMMSFLARRVEKWGGQDWPQIHPERAGCA